MEGRVLPWRERVGITPSDFAYRIWISEVMLQQTRVESVKQYFSRWMARFPNIQVLSEAAEDEVRQYWAGLGYYNRCTSIWLGAKELFGAYKLELPPADAWKNIKGIGAYTSGAIQSIVYG